MNFSLPPKQTYLVTIWTDSRGKVCVKVTQPDCETGYGYADTVKDAFDEAHENFVDKL